MSKLNIPLLKRLRTRFLRMRHPEHFNMEEVAQKTDCGAALCIAGHVLDLEGYKVRFDKDGQPYWLTPSGKLMRGDQLNAAQRLLGMRYVEAQSIDGGLFMEFHLKTPKQAAERIEEIIATGEVL